MFQKFHSNSIILLLLFVLFIPTTVFARVKPTSEFYVNDYANILSSETEEYIQNKSIKLNEVDGTQIVVVTVSSLDGESIEDYANSLFRDFGIGDSSKNNGLLILVSKGDREVRVEVGYGLEGIINDAKAGRFLDNYVIPYFKNDEWDLGIKNGYDAFYKEIVMQNNLDLSYSSPEMLESKSIDVRSFLFTIFLGILGGYFYGLFTGKKSGKVKGFSIIGIIFLYFVLKMLLPFLVFLYAACFIVPFGIMYLVQLLGIFNLVTYSDSGRPYNRYNRTHSHSSRSSYSSGRSFHGGGGSSGGGGASRKF